MGEEKKFKVPKNIPEDAVDVFLLIMDSHTKIRIVRDLLSGTKSFKQLSASTKCFDWQLKQYLNFLTDYGIVKTTVYPGVPMVIEYTLTQLGELMKPAINSMAEWGRGYRVSARAKH